MTHVESSESLAVGVKGVVVELNELLYRAQRPVRTESAEYKRARLNILATSSKSMRACGFSYHKRLAGGFGSSE